MMKAMIYAAGARRAHEASHDAIPKVLSKCAEILIVRLIEALGALGTARL